jgi:hypothetical protein
MRYDPTANFRMPASALREMVNAVPDSLVRDVAMRDARAPSGPSSQGVIPSSQQVSSVHPGGSSGWVRERPLGPSMHQRYVDEQLDEQDRRDRAERLARQGGRDG